MVTLTYCCYLIWGGYVFVHTTLGLVDKHSYLWSRLSKNMRIRHEMEGTGFGKKNRTSRRDGQDGENGEIWVKVYFAYIVIMRLWAQYSESKGSYNDVYHEYVLEKHKTAFIVQTFYRCIYLQWFNHEPTTSYTCPVCGENIQAGPIYQFPFLHN